MSLAGRVRFLHIPGRHAQMVFGLRCSAFEASAFGIHFLSLSVCEGRVSACGLAGTE